MTPSRNLLGLLGSFGGAPVPTAYLSVTSVAVDGDVRALLMGSAWAKAPTP